MTETKENNTESKKVFKIALKTLSFVFCGLMFFICLCFCLMPQFSLKISGLIGSKRAEEHGYERIYAKSGNNSDLYNLILFNQQEKDLSDELKYINELLSKKDYNEFCKAVDEASLKAVTLKELIPYSCDANAYIRGQKVACMYGLKEDLETYVLVQTSAGELSDLSVAVYVDLINEDESLTATQKSEKIISLMNKGLIVGGAYSGASEIINKRIDKLKLELLKDNSEAREIILQYSLARMYKANWLINSHLDNNVLAEEYRVLYNSENAKLKLLY